MDKRFDKSDIPSFKNEVKSKVKDAKISSLLMEIIDLMPTINEIPHINGGGCGIFAFLLWHRLKLQGYSDLEIEVVPLLIDEAYINPFMVEGTFDVEGLSKNLIDVANGNAEYSIPWDHMILALVDKNNNQSILVDSSTIEIIDESEITNVREDEYHAIGKPISYDILKKLISNPQGWNSHFNRQDSPHLKKILDAIK